MALHSDSIYSKAYKDSVLADFALCREQSPQLSIDQYMADRRRTDSSFSVCRSTLYRWLNCSAPAGSDAETTWLNDEEALVHPADEVVSEPPVKAALRMAPVAANLEIKAGGLHFVMHSAADAAPFYRISTVMQLLQSGHHEGQIMELFNTDKIYICCKQILALRHSRAYAVCRSAA